MNKFLYVFLYILCLNFIYCTELKPIFTKEIKDERIDRIIIDKDNMYLIKYSYIINFQYNESKKDGRIIICNLNGNIKNKINPYESNTILNYLLGLTLDGDNIYYRPFSILNNLYVFNTGDKEDKYNDYLKIYDKESKVYDSIKCGMQILNFYCKNNEIFFIDIVNDNPGLYKYDIIKKNPVERIIESKEMFDQAIRYYLYVDDHTVFMIEGQGFAQRYDIKTKNFKRFEIWDLLKDKTDISKIIKTTGDDACFYFNNGKYYCIYPLLDNKGNSDEALFTVYNIYEDKIETCFKISFGYIVYPRKMYYPNSKMKQYWRYIGPSSSPFDTSNGTSDTINNPLTMAVDDQGYIYIFDNFLSKLTKYELITDNNKTLKKYYSPTVSTLRLRESPSLNGKYIRTLKQGEKLELLETGKKETIDGIKGNWVKVRTNQGEEGWCFDGYLEEVKN